MNIKSNIAELIGNTPIVELKNVKEKFSLRANILAKLESANPAGSAKDRVALAMIDDAERSGRLEKGGVVIEPTSGNTGIALAAICAARGYRAMIVMPNSMSVERCRLMRAYGAELILTPGELGMKGAVDMAEELHRNIPGSIIAGQFENPANPRAHYDTTGPEIWRDTDGEVHAFVAGIGTGGTISGAGKFLKEKNPEIYVLGVEPGESPLITKGRAGSHGIQGIGANFIPANFDSSVPNEILPVSTENANSFGRMLAAEEGLLCGVSSGAALFAAVELAKRPEFENKNIVVLLPDTGERYLSSEIYK